MILTCNSAIASLMLSRFFKFCCIDLIYLPLNNSTIVCFLTATQGFVPKTVLKLYSEVTTGSAQNIYPSVDETVLLSDVTNNVIGEKSPISAPLIAITDSSSDTMSTNQIEDDENELDFALDEDMSPNISSEEVCFLNFLPIHVLHFLNNVIL